MGGGGGVLGIVVVNQLMWSHMITRGGGGVLGIVVVNQLVVPHDHQWTRGRKYDWGVGGLLVNQGGPT